MPDYGGLTRRLEGELAPEAQFSFAEVEEMIGSPLPASARKHQAWWANTATHSHAGAWMRSGWRTKRLDMAGERITFVRSDEPRAAPPTGVAEAAARWRGPGSAASRPQRLFPRVDRGVLPRADDRRFPGGLTPRAYRLLEVDCGRRSVSWEEAMATMLNKAADDYWKRMWAEADALSNGVVDTESSAEIIRRYRDGEEDEDDD